jgi:Putative prokaryotic signal transducing protein
MADDVAGKIDPRYSHGDLVKVARAQHQAEAEFVQSLLLEEGIPSMVRRSAGFDVPDMLAAGPRDVLVPSSGELAAREVLLQAELIDPEAATEGPVRSPGRLLIGLLAFVALVGVIAWVGTEIIG